MDTIKDAKTLRETVRLLERRFGMLDEGGTSCCDLSFSQCHALVEIGRAGEISLNDLAALLDLDKSTMSRTISALVGKGLATRESSPDDRRYVSIRLTGTGAGKFAAIETKMDDYYDRVYRSLPDDKKGQVTESLSLLLRSLIEIGDA